MSNLAEIQPKKSLVVEFADKYHVEHEKLLSTLKSTAFKQANGEVTNEQMMALLVVANQYNLNPFTKEIYAFPSQGGVTPIVSVDGWMKMINEHPQFDGMQFEDHISDGKLTAITCKMYRKDRTHPVEVTEYMSECARGTQPWKQWPARMLRHKAAIQAARYAFSFSGVYDPDEGERIREAEISSPEYQSYTNDQKVTFDRLIKEDDALGMYCFSESLGINNDATSPGASVWISLVNSFPKGEKGKYKDIVGALMEKGKSMAEDYVNAILDALESGDDLAVKETFSELDELATLHIKNKLTSDEIKQLDEILVGE